jgi:CBS domain-containing protein/ribosome-associated translation inhibitor RaiA
MRTKLPTVGPEDKATKAARLLSRSGFNSLLVSEGEDLVGHIMRRMLLRPPISPETKVDRMLSHPAKLERNESVDDAIARVLQADCDMLPVVDGGKLQGAVLARDLAFQDRSLRGLTLESVIDRATGPIGPDIAISEAASMMRNSDLESLPVVQDDELIGWVSFSDLQRYMFSPEKGVRGKGEYAGEKEHPLRNPVKHILGRDGTRVDLDDDLHKSIGTLCSSKVNEFTILDRETVLGQVNIRGILAETRGQPDILVQVAGLEEEDPMVVQRVLSDLKASARKVNEIWDNVETPELKVKSYHHKGSKRKRYEVRVSFAVPEHYVAEAKGWDLLTTCQAAIKKVEKELRKQREKIIDSHQKRI